VSTDKVALSTKAITDTTTESTPATAKLAFQPLAEMDI